MAVTHPRGIHGFTLMELLIAGVLVSMVIAGATSMYLSSINFLNARLAVDATTSPDIAFEPVARRIAAANAANTTLGAGNTQLNIRVDQACDGTVLNTPTTTDDSWWHYRFLQTNLYAFCENPNNTTPTLANLGNPPGTVAVLDTLTNNASAFALINPSAAGVVPTVVRAQLRSPTVNIDTEISLGAASKR